VAIARTSDVAATGALPEIAFTEGFQTGSLVAAGFNVVGALAAVVVLRRAERVAAPDAAGAQAALAD
jgi:hypothetical protein